MINRIIDANLNRIIEALRVIEDINRFYFNDLKNSTLLKNYRHKIIQNFKNLNLHLFRDTVRDKVKFLNTPSEFNRNNINDIIHANTKRIQQASRVLEETLKVNNKKKVKLFKQLRFYMYKLEKDMIVKIQKQINISLLIIIDTDIIPFIKIKKTLLNIIELDATAILICLKDTVNSKQYNILKEIKKITQKNNIHLIIKDRIDIAIAVDADSVFITQKSPLNPSLIRTKFSYNKSIGFSAENEKEIKKGFKHQADYIILESHKHTQYSNKNAVLPTIQKSIKLINKYYKKIPIALKCYLETNNFNFLKKSSVNNLAVFYSIKEFKKAKKILSQYIK